MNVVVRTADGPKALVADDIGDVLELTDELLEPPPDVVSGPRRTLTTRVFKLPTHLLIELDVAKLTDLTHQPNK